MPDKVRVTKPD